MPIRACWQFSTGRSRLASDNDIIRLLQSRRREDPKMFRKFLPGMEDLLPPLERRQRARSPFGLTERERAFHEEGLATELSKLRIGQLTRSDAVKALSNAAQLIRDDNLPCEADHQAMKNLTAVAIGKSPSSVKSRTTFPLVKDADVTVLESVPAIRGVYLNLGKSNRLVSVSVVPAKVKEFREMMRIVGIGAEVDTATDVSARHDEYLALQDPHGDS